MCNAEVVGLPGVEVDDKVDDEVDETGPLLLGKPVSLNNGSKQLSPFREKGQALVFRNNVVVKLGAEPAGLGEVDTRVSWAGEIPVDEGDGHPVVTDDVPGGDVAVSDHPV